jgi:single-stranded-DNA-specific exonuclease
MEEKHLRLRVSQGVTFSAVGWNLAEEAAALNIGPDSLIDLAWRLRHNDHPDFGGLELEIAALRPAELPS